MNWKYNWVLLFLLLLGGVMGLAACQSSAATAVPASKQASSQTEKTATSTSSPKASATKSPSRTPTRTAAPTNTPSPTKTATPILTPSLTTTPLPTPTPTVPLIIDSFSATVEDYEPAGKDVTFSWSVSGATSVRIYSGTNQYFAKWWNVTDHRSYTVALGRTMFRNPTMTLIASNGRGGVALKTINISWECDYEYFFSPVPLQCPWHEESYSNAVEQSFENGRMIWIERIRQDDNIRENRIYVFVDPNHDGIGNWRRFDEVVPGADNFNEQPPEGRYEPQGGFGEVWRQNAALRRDIGWATGPEASFQTAWQYQLTEAGTAAAYVRTIDGRIIELFGSRTGGWRYIDSEE